MKSLTVILLAFSIIPLSALAFNNQEFGLVIGFLISFIIIITDHIQEILQELGDGGKND